MPTRDVETSIIGIVGTASQGPENDPIEIRSMTKAIEVFGPLDQENTLVKNLSAIFMQLQTRPRILAVRVSPSGSSTIEDSWENTASPRRSWTPNGAAKDIIKGSPLRLPYSELASGVEASWVIDVDEDWSDYISIKFTVSNSVGLRIGISTSAKDETGNTIFRIPDIAAQTDAEETSRNIEIDLTASNFQVNGAGGYTSDIKNLEEIENIEIALISSASEPVDGEIKIHNITITRETEGSGIGDEASKTGAFSFPKAISKYGFKPSILIAPQMFKSKADADKLFQVAVKLKSHLAVIERPRPTIASEGWELQYSNIPNNSRIKVVYPANVILEEDDITIGMSALWAGVRIRTDDERGWEVAASNKGVVGVKRLETEVEYIPDEPCEALDLNDVKVTTLVNDGGTWKIWGSQTLADGEEAKLSFVVARRTKDIIDATIKANERQVLDEGVKKRFIPEVVNRVNQQFRTWINVEERILGGQCWFDEDKNPPEQLASGTIIWSYDFTPIPVAKKLVFESITTDRYIAEVFANANN